MALEHTPGLGVGRLIPLFEPTIEQMMEVPDNSEVLYIPEGDVTCVPWVEENREEMRKQVPPGGTIAGLFAYLPPRRTPSEIIREVLGKRTVFDITEGLREGTLDESDLMDLFSDLAKAE